jgi:hypothetical protein
METILCNVCENVKSATEFRPGRKKCKKCENQSRMANHKKNKAENPEYAERQKGYDRKRKQLKRASGDELFNFVETLRGRTKDAFTNKGYTKKSKTFELLGCDQLTLFEHFELRFQEGMTWENHSFEGWHVDHVIPLASANTEEELIKLCHFTNLQPLWAKENLEKGNKIL